MTLSLKALPLAMLFLFLNGFHISLVGFSASLMGIFVAKSSGDAEAFSLMPGIAVKLLLNNWFILKIPPIFVWAVVILEDERPSHSKGEQY
ncbi:MAG: hypothetical protein H6658_20375 [Ardenticatenaceae bacterium]|nr:hypothetical protein [Ardenticatenaceae bacterium]